ncbi:MAG TPA: aminotransferase class I/II-fold pyridoxal phosphate-dependent enzyme [Pyrinomonadaceae bacterium]|nr:aminotransferase class I/II-fold pyridoxal phosphate-dependent enzyme [Pyrinomonadaceae bacterium]
MSEKRTVNDLAILGGPKTFAEVRHVGAPNVGDRARLFARIDDLLDRRWLTNDGPLVQDFEKQISEKLGVRHCVALTNATIALEITIRALEISGEVIVPSLTFIATAHALQWHGITPVFCDVDPKTFTLDPDRVEELITPQTSAIMGVHLWGQPCRIDKLTGVARRNSLKLIFDAAHAFGCSWNGRMIGSFGDAEVFSFHATKFFNTFEGGAVVTNDDKLARQIRVMRNFGFAGYDEVVSLGTNGKMSEVSAAMGLTGLESLQQFIDANHSNHNQYREELSDVNGITLLTYDETEKNNYQYLVLFVDEAQTGITRDQLMNLLWAENVRARRYFYPGCHRMQPYDTLYPDAAARLPVTESVVQQVLLLPTGTTISPEDITRICQIIKFAVSHGEELNQLMSAELGTHAG